MRLLKSTVFRKLLMGVTGLYFLLFVVGHLLGNASIFLGAEALNAYAAHLHSVGPLIWVVRAVMLALIGTHILFAIILTLENWRAKPEPYAVRKKLHTDFAAENMIWTGALLGAFIVYHLLHFTAHLTHPEISNVLDEAGRPDVHYMVSQSFKSGLIALLYVGAMVALFLHLSHGIQSVFQTLGLNDGKILPVLENGGRGVAIAIGIGFVLIPILIYISVLA